MCGLTEYLPNYVIPKERYLIFAEATELFEKHEKTSVSEHFTAYLSVARFHAKVFYLKDSQFFIPRLIQR
jgi:hypothetical protein